MRTKLFITSLLSALCLLGLALAGPASAEPRYRGYNESTVARGLLTPNKAAWLSGYAGGANVARITFDWRWVEPRKDEYHFERYDDIYNTYLSYGIRVVFVPLFAPSWAMDSNVNCDQYTQDCTYPPGRKYDDQWRQINTELAKRYPQAAGIEVWNEPNLHYFWKPRPDVKRYTALLKQAYAAIKNVNPSMPVVSGGLSNNTTTTAIDTSLIDFAKGMYSYGAKSSTDALGVHPYPGGLNGWFVGKSLDDLRAVRNSYSDQSKKLWLTEFGFTTTGSLPQSVTPEQQASGLVSHWRALKAMSDIDLIAIHTLMEVPGHAGTYDQSDPEVGYGVIDRDVKPKPAFCALSVEWGKPNPCP